MIFEFLIQRILEGDSGKGSPVNRTPIIFGVLKVASGRQCCERYVYKTPRILGFLIPKILGLETALGSVDSTPKICGLLKTAPRWLALPFPNMAAFPA